MAAECKQILSEKPSAKTRRQREPGVQGGPRESREYYRPEISTVPQIWQLPVETILLKVIIGQNKN